MKLLFIILITSFTYFTAAEIHEQTQEQTNNDNGKAVTSSYTYSIEYSDNTNDGKYGHRIEVKDGSAKVNVHAQHPKSVEQVVSTQPERYLPVPQKTSGSEVPQHQPQSAQVSYIPATHHQEGHGQYQQKLKFPVNNDPKLPIHTYDQQQLALLLTQNKNPFLPTTSSRSKENNQMPHHQQVLSLSKQPQSQPQKVTYYVPQSSTAYTKPQGTTPTYSKPSLTYTVDPKYAAQGVIYKQDNSIQYEQSPKMVQYQYEYSPPEPPQLNLQPMQYMQLGQAQVKSGFPNYNNYYDIPLSSGLSGLSGLSASSDLLGHGLQYSVPSQTSPTPHSGHQNSQHHQAAPTTASGETTHAPTPQYYSNLPQLSNQHAPQYIPQTVLQPAVQYKQSASSSFGYPQHIQVSQHPQQHGGHQVGPVQFLPQSQAQPQGHSLSHLIVKPQIPNQQNHFVYQPAVPATSKSSPQVPSYPSNLFASGQYEFVYPGQKQNTGGAGPEITKGPSFRSLGPSPGHFGGGKPQIASASQAATKYINLPVQSVHPAPAQGNSYHFVNLQGHKPTIPVDKIPYKDSNTFNYNQLDYQPNKNVIYIPQHSNHHQNNFRTTTPSSSKQQIQPHQTVIHKLALNIPSVQSHSYYSQPSADSGYKTATPGVPAAAENGHQQIKYVYVPSYHANPAESVNGK